MIIILLPEKGERERFYWPHSVFALVPGEREGDSTDLFQFLAWYLEREKDTTGLFQLWPSYLEREGERERLYFPLSVCLVGMA